MSSDSEKESSIPVQEPKSKPQISALEKYGFLNSTSKPQVDDYEQERDDDYDDDDFVDDYEDDDANAEQSMEDGITEEEFSDIHENEEKTGDDEEEEEEEDSDFEFSVDEDSEKAGDWHLINKVGTEEDSEEMENEEEMHERRERRLSTIRHNKDNLIGQYLTLMKHLGRAKRKSLYLQDYLYKLCFRKKLIKEPSEVKRAISANHKSAAKLKRQKKRLDTKMAANYEAFVNSKPPVAWSPQMKVDKKPTRGQLNRARRLVGESQRAPLYSTKLDTKFVSLRGIQYQRLLRSASRNWPQNVEQDETKLAIIEQKKNAEKYNRRQEIPHGIPGAPKHRILVEVVPSGLNNGKKRLGTQQKNEDILNTVEDPNVPEDKEVCKDKICNKQRKSHAEEKRQSRVSGSQLENQKYNHRKSRRSTKGKSILKVTETAINQLIGPKEVQVPTTGEVTRRRSSHRKSDNTFTPRRIFEISKHRCRRKKNKRFREFHWFESGKLKGRQFSGTKLLSAEKQHLINFVSSAIQNKNSHERSHKLKKKRQLNSTELDWNEALKRLFQLILKKEDLEKQHEKTMQRKFVDWGLWEKRNTLGVEGLFNLFKLFVQQDYFTKGELRRFNPDLNQFDHLLHHAHIRLMDQLLKMYKSRLSLLLVHRKLKDKTNQTLAQQGFSIGYYEQLFSENKALYGQIQGREQHLEKQGQKLASIMKTMVLTRDHKGSIKTSVTNLRLKYRVVLEDCQNKRNSALEVMDKLSGIMKKNKPLLLQASLVEKPHFLRDFTTRKKCFEGLEAQKRNLNRQVYLGERELNSIHVKMKNTQRSIRELTDTNTTRQTLKELRLHKSIINGRLDSFIAKSTNHCGDNPYQKQIPSPLTKKATWR